MLMVGDARLDAVLLLVLAVPLHAIGGDVPNLVGHLGEKQLPDDGIMNMWDRAYRRDPPA
jgi:hypothetical protein